MICRGTNLGPCLKKEKGLRSLGPMLMDKSTENRCLLCMREHCPLDLQARYSFPQVIALCYERSSVGRR